MINEIVLNKKYKVVDDEYTRTPLFLYPPYVFYEYNHKGLNHNDCTFCRIDLFKRSVEEIPEPPVE